jgi:hypothetical protein
VTLLHTATFERFWKSSSAASTTPPCGYQRLSHSGRPAAACPAEGGGGSTWPPPNPAPGAAGPTTVPPAKPAASNTGPSTRCAPSLSRPGRVATRVHLKTYSTRPDVRLFRTARGRPLEDSACSAVWQAARTAAALTQASKPPAGPPPLRPAPRRRLPVAQRRCPGDRSRPPRQAQRRHPAQGLRRYIDGQTDTVNKRIASALGGNEETAWHTKDGQPGSQGAGAQE